MTHAVRFHRLGGPEVLTFEEVVVPPPRPGEVRVDIKAIGLNRADTSFRSGTYIERPVLPAGLGLEAAGIVESIGDGVTGFFQGQLVGLVPPVSMSDHPTYAERANFPARLLVPSPPELDAVMTAALWMAYFTAYGAIIDLVRAGEGDAIAITAASSSVGLAAIQIANMIGAVPIALTRSNAKADRLRELGAHAVIATNEGDLASRLRSAAGGRRLVMALDAVGGPDVSAIAEAMTSGGQILEYGGLSSEATPFPLGAALGKQLLMRGYLVHHVTTDRERLQAATSAILNGVRSGLLRPVVDKTFPFAHAADAHRHLEDGDQVGKVVLTL